MDKIVGNYQRNRSALIGPGVTYTLISEQYFGAACHTVITAIGSYVNDAAAWGNVEFKIYLDGALHEEFGSFYDQIGSQDTPRKIPAGYMKANSKVEVVIVNHHATETYGVGFMLQGDYVANS